MKPWIKESIWNAVKGLWLSGLYGTGAGSVAGVVCGAIVGLLFVLYLIITPLPPESVTSGIDGLLLILFFAMIYGGSIGGVVGAYVGLPAGILGGGLGGQRGVRNGTALAALSMGSGLIEIFRRNTDYDGSMQIPFLLLAAFTLVSAVIGHYMYRLLQTESGLFARWRFVLDHCGIEQLSAKDRAISSAIAIAPVVLAYGYFLLSSLKHDTRIVF